MHSFLRLKLIEETKSRLAKRENSLSPNFNVIKRLRQKIEWFEKSNTDRKIWSSISASMVANDEFHADWRDLIKELESSVL